MSIYSDISAERSARGRSGAPIGPYVKPKIFFDEDGMFTVWPDKACSVCGLGLTSRNRYNKTTLCIEHGREHERNRVRKPRPSVASATLKAGAGPTPRPEQDATQRRLQSLFTHWCMNPTNDDHCDALRHAMGMHELNERIKRIIPPLPVMSSLADATGLADVAPEAADPINPEHRSTRLEFLADCSTYGA